MYELLFSMGLVLLISALCSGAEAALFSVQLVKAKQAVETKTPGGHALLAICENMQRPIMTIVISQKTYDLLATIGSTETFLYEIR